MRAERSWLYLMSDTTETTIWVHDGGPTGEEKALAKLLLPPCDTEQVLAACANPRCGVFEGDSEAGRTLKRCGGKCRGEVAYCCVGCQRAHWKAEHKQQCGRPAVFVAM